MSVDIACKQNILVTDFHLLKLLLVVFGFGSQTNVRGFSRQNIFSVLMILRVVKLDYFDLPCEIFEILCELDIRVMAYNFKDLEFFLFIPDIFRSNLFIFEQKVEKNVCVFFPLNFSC